MRVLWTARRSNQSILKEISPEYSLEKTLMLGKTEGGRRGRQEFEQASGVGDGQGILACCSSRGHKELDMNERLNIPLYIYTPYFVIHSSVDEHLRCFLPSTGFVNNVAVNTGVQVPVWVPGYIYPKWKYYNMWLFSYLIF